MPSPFRGKKKKPAAGSGGDVSPLAARERELAAEQHRLQAQIAELQRNIEEAPRRRAEQAQRDREAMLDRARQSTYETRRAGALPDKRFTGGMGGRTHRARSIGGRRAMPVLRHERRAAMLKTLAMLAVFVVIVCYLIYNYFL